jgi:hypothetical protein
MADQETNDEVGLVPAGTRAETALDAAAVVMNMVPWIGGAVAAVLGGMAVNRKLGRVREVLEGVARELKDFKSEASEAYVKTEDFEELLERTLRQAAEERSEEKRRVYKNFLAGAIESPGEPYDEQLRVLRALEGLEPDHLRVLQAFVRGDANPSVWAGSPGQTLVARLPGMPEERVKALVGELNDMKVTNLSSFHVLMTGAGAQNLQHFVTPLGQRLLGYIEE